MRFKDLADVHPRRHAERIQHHVNRCAISHVWHVFHWHDARHHTFVAVAAGHLVAGLQTALHRDIHLDHLLHAGLQLITLGQLLLLQLEGGIKLDAILRQAFLDLLHLGSHLVIGHADIEPLMMFDAMQIFLAELAALDQLLRPAVGDLVMQQFFQPRENVGLHDAHLIRQILLVTVQLVIDDLLRTLVALQPFAREHLHVDHRSRAAGRHTQAGIFHVRCLLAENRAQQLFFRGQLRFALGRHLADQHVAHCDFRTDMHDAAFVQARQLRFCQIRDIAGNFFRAELGVTRRDGQLFDVDGSEAILRQDTLGNQDRILIVVAIPRHERDQHVLAKSQLAHVSGGAVGNHIAARNHVAHLDQRTLVDVGVLVGTGVFDQVVNIHADFAGSGFVVIGAHHDTARIDIVNASAAPCLHGCAGVDCHGALDAGAHQRLFRTQARDRLALHVGTHQGTVGIVMLQERDQRSRNRHHLGGRHVHIFQLVRFGQNKFVVMARRHDVVGEVAFLVQFGVRLGDGELAFFDRGQIIDLIGHLALGHLAVGRFDETVFVGARIQRQRVDQADVRAFRRFDRAHATIVGRMHVTYLEAGTFTRQAARPQRGNAALVGDFGQRIGLVHELRQLAGAEEFLDRSRDRLGIDQVMRHQVVGFGLTKAFLDGALHTRQTGAKCVFCQLADGTDTTVAEVIDVIDFTAAIAQLDQNLHHFDDIFVGQNRCTGQLFAPDAAVEFHAPDGRQVIAFFAEKQPIEQAFDSVFGGWLAGTHHAVYRHTRRPLIGGFIGAQGLRNECAVVQIIGVQRVNFADAGNLQVMQQRLGDFIVGVGDDFAAVLVHDIGRNHAADQELFGYGQLVYAGLLHFADMAHGDALVLGYDDLAGFADDIETRHIAAQTLGHHLELDAFLAQVEYIGLEEHLEHVFVAIAERTQQDGDRHLAAAVDTEIHVVLRVEFKIQPGTAIRNDARGEQQLAG